MPRIPLEYSLQHEEKDPGSAFRKLQFMKAIKIDGKSIESVEEAVLYLRVLYFNENDLYFCEDSDLHDTTTNSLRYDQPDNLRKSLFTAKKLLPLVFEGERLKSELAKLYRMIDEFCAPATALKSAEPFSGKKTGIDYLIPRGYRGVSQLGCSGLFALEDIEPESIILSIAESEIINLFTALRDPQFSPIAVQLLGEGQHPDTVVLLYLVHLRNTCNRADSTTPESVKLFFEGLSDSFGTLMEWPIEAVDALGLEAVSAEVQKHKDILLDIHASLPEHLCPAFSDLLWAKTLCSSRSFMNGNMTPISDLEARIVDQHLPNKRLTCVIPGADLLNHNPRGQCSVPQFNAETRRLEIKAECFIPKNTEIFLNYGGIANWEFLFHSGFILPVNPYDIMEIELEADEPAIEHKIHQEGLPLMHFIRHGYPKISKKFVKAVRIVTGEENPYECIESLLTGMCGQDPQVTEATDWWLEEYGDKVVQFRTGYKRMLNEALALIKEECEKKKKGLLLRRRK